MDSRHEWKHEINCSDLFALRARLRAVMEQDSHAISGKYEIRSMYFDNIHDKALREKIDGVNCREKFRIRYYNGDTSFILLEKKSKINGLCNKVQTELAIDEVNSIIRDCTPKFSNGENSLIQELFFKMKTQGLKPKTIVDYTREPFVYAPGNVRVTLDYNIRTSMCVADFLKSDCVTVPADSGKIILEVKWDTFLPSLIRDIVQTPGTQTAAFSKYAVSRIYG